MEFLKAQANQIGEQLKGMTNSQRIAIVLSAVVVLAGAWGLLSWAGGSEWTPVLDQSLSGSEIQRVAATLVAAGIETRIQSEQVMIKGDTGDRRRAQAVLAQADAMPRDTTSSYAEMLKDDNVFRSDRATTWRWNRGLEFELSSVLREFRGVQTARVFLIKSEKRGFRRGGKASSASVAVTMDGDQGIPQKLVASIAHFVAGSAGLSVGDIRITDGFRSYRPPDPANAMPTEQLELQRQIEEHHAKKIYDQLRHIAGVVVNVHATLRTANELITKKKVGKLPVKRESTSTDEESGGGDATGPGVKPNQGRAIASVGPSQTSLKEETEVDYGGETDVDTTQRELKAGQLERLLASVTVPRAYLEQIVMSGRVADDTSPITPTEFENTSTDVLPRIKALVMPLINASADNQVVVDWYYDAAPEGEVGLATSPPLDYVALAREFGPQVGLGILALFGVFAVLRMAKKGQAALGESGGGKLGAGVDDEGGGAVAIGPDGKPVLAALAGGPTAVGEVEEL
ncbi:MAG: hypothetical protein O7D94_11475, partial [Planctomycetota bacterium]|nr:hypothetical protein [Planctomycetota bacterium]